MNLLWTILIAGVWVLSILGAHWVKDWWDDREYRKRWKQ